MPRILVADDNSNIQKMVALAFAEHGIDVVAVGNGEAAVRRMPDLNPDVVLADVFMPVRNGYEVCEYIKKDPRFAKTPVILLVGAFDPLDEQEARRVGADGVLKKPFVPPDPLIAMVTSALEKAPKPEVKAAAPEPVAEIPKIVAPPPPPVAQTFPDPTPEEEAYMFGSGRRSLDDDDKVEAAAPRGNTVGAPAAVQTVETGLDTEADVRTEAEEDEKFSGTRADWRRREEVDFEAVPSFSSQLVDAPADAPVDALANAAKDISKQIEQMAEQRAETSEVTADAVADAAPLAASPAASVATFEVAPPVEADPFAYQPEAEVRSVVATSSVESVAEAPAAEIVESALPASFELQAGAPDVARVSYSPAIEAPAVEPEPAQIAQVETGAEVVEAAPAKLEELPARIEAPPAPEPAPILSSVVETVTSPRKWLDFLLPSRAPKPSAASAEPAASIAEPAPPAEPVATHSAVDSAPFAAATPAHEEIASETHASAPAVEETPAVEAPAASAPAQEVAAPEPAVVLQDSAPATGTSESAPPAAEPSEVRPIEDLRQHWSEIASQLAAEAPLVEAAQTAMAADRSASADAAEPARENFTENVAPSDSSAVAQSHAPEEAAAPQSPSLSMETLAAAISATAAQAAAPAASPNIDEVVAKILEKLGPQIQELIAKGVVKPLVEDILKHPDEPKK